MSLSVYIVDDEEFSAKYLAELVTEMPGLNLLGYETNAPAALEKILHRTVQPDVLLLDIEMPLLDGIAFAGQVNHLTCIVFITAKDRYPLQAFEVGAYDYLLKPLGREPFLRSMNRMKERLSNRNTLSDASDKRIEFRFGLNHESRFIDPREIVYAEASSNYVLVNSSAGQLVKVISTMDEMAALLGPQFMKVHRSFIVRMDRVDGLDGYDIRMSGGAIIPLGRSFREAFRARLKDYIK